MPEDTIDYIGDELDLFKNATNWKSYFSGKLSPYISGHVLEVGAGIGINTPFLCRKETSAKVDSWTLLEPDPHLAARIPKSLPGDLAIETKVINGTITSAREQIYDTIIYIDVMEHIEHSHKEVALAKEHLSKDGRLIILAPAFNWLYNAFDKRIGHFRRYDKAVLRSEIDGRLAEEKLFYLDSIGLLASVANKLFLHKSLPSHKDIHFWDKKLLPLSKVCDPVIGYAFGKSLIGIYKNQ